MWEFSRFSICLTTKWSLSCLLRPIAIVLALLPSSSRPCAQTTIRYSKDGSMNMGGTHYVQIQKRQQNYLALPPCKTKRDHWASSTANFSRMGRHYSHTLLTGVFNSRLIPSDIRRYLGSTVSVTFLAL